MKQKNILKIALFFLLISGVSYGQDILTFEFSALSGSEATASSNSNDANLSSSTISRGSGLTASNNGGRFNATSWATTSIANAVSNDDYMEFTITPNASFQFSVSSIEINLQRSGTGPSAIAIRNSIDGYTTNLDSEKAIVDNTSTQSFTFTFAQANSAVAVTYRIYMYAESTSGSGGIGDFTGDDIVVNGLVSAASTDTKVSFVSATSSVSENGTSIDICASISNPDATNATTVEIALDGASTASNPGDFTPASAFPVTLTFPAGSSANQCLTINITNDAITEPSETVVLNLQNPAGGNSASLGVISQNTLTILDDDLPNIIITEIMYNSTGTDDEWIELYNNNGTDVDISGYKLIYNSTTFLFPNSTTFTNGTYITIAVGSDGNAPFNPDNGFTPDFNNLAVSNANVATTSNTNNLGNTSGTIEFRNADDALIDTVDYDDGDDSNTDGNGPSYEIIDNTSDNALTSANWQASVISGGSPGRISGTVWTGTTSSDWLAGNFSNGLPTTTSDVSIPAGLTFYPTVSSAITVNALNIESGATLIATNTFTGTVNYNRTLANGSQWYLMSSPVVGETFDAAWANSNSIPASALNTSNIGIGYYDNTSLDTDDDGAGSDTATGHWRYLQSDDTNSANFNGVGKGYSVIRSGSGAITFTGTGIHTSSQTATITYGAANPNNYNLIGNPFTSYLNLGDFFTDNNTANLIGSTVWFYNGSSYDSKLSGTDGSFEIAPGQGFFVEAGTAAVGSDNLTFNINSTSHQGSDTFQKNNPREEVYITINDGSDTKYAKVFYIDGTTKGFDNGYDGKLFGGVSHSFAIYSDLVVSDGKKYQVQSLPNTDHENMVVPIGVIATSAKEITFTAEAMNLPEGIKVFLEDKVTNTMTRLNEANATYKVTLTEALNGIGRFYLHTKSSGVLGTETIVLDNVSVYSVDASTLRVAGLSEGKANVKIYSILGKQVFETSFNATGVKDMQLPKLASGIYVVQLATEKGTLNKKITLE